MNKWREMRRLPKYNQSYTTTFFFFVFVFVFVYTILFRPVSSINVNTLLSTDFLTLSSNRTIVSPRHVFELGFFKTTSNFGDDDLWYLGIWYKTIPEKTYVWIANRDKPLLNSKGTLKISNNNLLLLNHADTPIWSTNLTGRDVRYPMVAELLDNGNFVLRGSETSGREDFLWQSFDFPTDTLLPQMEMGWDLKTGRNKFLRSWRNQYEPSSGDFSYRLQTEGLPEFFLWKLGLQVFRSGPWDGTRFSGLPDMQQWNNVNIGFNFTESKEKVAFTFRANDHNIYSRLIMSISGFLQLSIWDPALRVWEVFWLSSMEQCDMYLICGPNSYCDMNTSPLCNCLKGFVPMDLKQWDSNDGSSGCVRTTRLSCNRDEFLPLKKMKLPDTTAATVVDRKFSLKGCEAKCFEYCNCTAFANTDIRDGGLGCVIWTGELLDIRSYAKGGQDLYVRLAATDMGKERKGKNVKITILIVVLSSVFLLGLVMFCMWKKKKRGRTIAKPIEINQDFLVNGMVTSSRRPLFGDNVIEESELPLMEFEDIVVATKNFSDCNKLGKGGFGIVYKGELLDGQEIAVKRLSKMSLQGTNEFKNEVKLISRLQHINLVRLLGCCIDAGEKMLIYEYLENLSLDSHLFDKIRSCKLNWKLRFDIINGIARGLLYLHQDSRFRIIHRDLKASNVLLDKHMTPKISDFGMARIFGRDETEANTLKVVGTYGYMSPEYAMDGIFSTKSDVFSFGVMLLEIISGKRNKGFYNSSHDLNLLGCVWRNWKEGKGIEIVDPIIVDSLSSSSSSTFRPQEVLRCIQIGLLCVQERAEDRPMMPSVVLMLGSETVEIPQPKLPGYCVGRSPLETDFLSNEQCNDESCTVNQITISVIEAR